ncbi:MAG: transketolase C-terminal domain-containing protein, partial [Myxococcota bacterium]
IHKPIENEEGEIVYGTYDSGSDVLIVTAGSMLYESIMAARLLEKENLSVTVFNSRFVKPLDKERIKRLSRFSDNIITIEENTVIGGLGSNVNQILIEDNLRNRNILNIGIPDRFIEHGPREIILNEIGLTYKKMAERIKIFIKESKKNNIINYPISKNER